MGNFTIGCPLSEGNIGGNYSNITEGQVRIYCRLIDGFPFPNISWFYNGSELIMFRNSSEISITVENDTIGEYTCVATNALGIGSSISFVDIQCKLVNLYCSSVIKTLVLVINTIDKCGPGSIMFCHLQPKETRVPLHLPLILQKGILCIVNG